MTAAWSLGIGSCYIGDVMEQCETQKEILHLPKYVFPAVMAVFGYPTEQQSLRPKPRRFSLKDIVCENTFHEKSGAGLRAMFEAERCPDNYDEWMEKFCNRKYNSDFSKEMTRSVERYLEEYGLKK